jgi:hypothetical protein
MGPIIPNQTFAFDGAFKLWHVSSRQPKDLSYGG